MSLHPPHHFVTWDMHWIADSLFFHQVLGGLGGAEDIWKCQVAKQAPFTPVHQSAPSKIHKSSFVCLPLAGVPSTPSPNLTLQHCYITFIMLISWSRGQSGQFQKCIFSQPKWVQTTHRVPQNPPECQISSKCQRFVYNIKYLALRWGIGGFELGGELKWDW